MRLDDQLFLTKWPFNWTLKEFWIEACVFRGSLRFLYHLHSLRGRCCSSPFSQRADATMFLSCSVWMNYERFNEVIHSVWWIVWIQFAGQRFSPLEVKVQLGFFFRDVFSPAWYFKAKQIQADWTWSRFHFWFCWRPNRRQVYPEASSSSPWPLVPVRSDLREAARLFLKVVAACRELQVQSVCVSGDLTCCCKRHRHQQQRLPFLLCRLSVWMGQLTPITVLVLPRGHRDPFLV